MRSLRLGLLGVTLLGFGAGRAAAQTTYNACYVPSVGAIYLINQAGLPTACLAQSHVAFSWISGAAVADGSITLAKLAFDPATQAELNAVLAQLAAIGTINTSANPVDWTQLKNVPAGLADGVDDGGGTASELVCTSCVAASDMANSAVTTAKIANAAVTAAKLDFDPATQAELDAVIAGLAAAGTINTSTNPVDWTQLKNVPAGFADGVDAGGTGTSDHGGLTGLTDDDHPQYLLGNAARVAVGGFAVTGTFGTGALAATGGGVRLLWYPRKGAFRAGAAFGTAWDDANVGDYSVAMGATPMARGDYSLAIGTGTQAIGVHSTALGALTTAGGDSSTALGAHTTANGIAATALGRNTMASGHASLATGANTLASGSSSTAMGDGSIASGSSATAMGLGSVASNFGSTAMGFQARAEADWATAMGRGIAGGSGSIASGTGTASGQGSIAMGVSTIASALTATAIGHTATASGDHSTAMGVQTTAIGRASIALGSNTRASGHASMAIGLQTVAGGDHSAAMGTNTQASGDVATSMGQGTTAFGVASVAMGIETTARPLASLVIGRYNNNGSGSLGSPTSWVATDPLFVAGNGSGPAARTDALALYKNGNLLISGNLGEGSDLRYKEHIEPMESALDGVLRLRPIRYRFRAGTGYPTERQIGLGAQDVEPVFPELVHRDAQGRMSVAYTHLAAVLVRAVQEQQATIAALLRRIEQLERSGQRVTDATGHH